MPFMVFRGGRRGEGIAMSLGFLHSLALFSFLASLCALALAGTVSLVLLAATPRRVPFERGAAPPDPSDQTASQGHPSLDSAES